MAKVYDHAVIYNGKFYPTGSDVPVKETKVETKVEAETTKAVKANDKSRNSKA